MHPWKTGAWFESEAEAIEYLKYMLGVGTLGTLTIQSAAGNYRREHKNHSHPRKDGDERVLLPDWHKFSSSPSTTRTAPA